MARNPVVVDSRGYKVKMPNKTISFAIVKTAFLEKFNFN